jgi:hypothetical protein
VVDSSDDEEEEVYAVKIVSSDVAEILEASEKEFEIIKSLNHDNLSKGYEIYKDSMNNEICQVIKYFKGSELLD